MAITAEEFRRHYQSLPDGALLELNPDELNPIARDCYHEEIAHRGLGGDDADDSDGAGATAAPDSGPATAEEMVCIVEYDYPDEADMARGLLESAEIETSIESEPGLVRLMVPAHLAEEALSLLATPLSDEELAAQAEAAAGEDDEEEGAE